ncbi:MAG: hypothetical protein HKN76_01465 [Saprospiraceae bacterium]|nr:hypothetical protein [Saprospiraceae bacterium]
MRTSIYIWLMFLGLSLITCREVDEFIPVSEPVEFDIGREFAEPSDTLQYDILLNEAIVITTPRGTEFVFKPDMFLFEDGSYCSCEKVKIQIIEIEKKQDYLVHQTQTVSDNRVLVSAGAYHVSASFNGKELHLSPGHQLCFLLPSNQLDDEMELFYGEQSSTGFNWTPAATTSGSQAFVKAGQWQFYDTTALILGYECFSDRISWINVDKFASEGITNNVCVALDTSFNAMNTVVFAVLVKENSILELTFAGSAGRFCSTNIPVGTKVIFVGINKQGPDQYEMATEEVEISANHFQALNFLPKSYDDIKAFLADL